MLFFKGLLQKPAPTVIGLLLILTAILLYVLGAVMSARAEAVVTEEPSFTEIAVIMPQPRANGLNVMDIQKMYEDVAFRGLFSESTARIDARIFAGAYSADVMPVFVGREPEDDYTSWHHNQDFGVFAVTCTEVTVRESALMSSYSYTFRVDRELYPREAFSLAGQETVRVISDSVSGPVKEPLAEEGKTYLFWGEYFPYQGSIRLMLVFNRLQHPTKKVEDNGTHFLAESVKGSGNYVPLISELTGSVEDFLKTEMGQLWQKTVMDRIDVCDRSLCVIGTDCLESIYTFNSGDAVITDGMSFDARQYEDGERVCVISRDLAELNGLQVGDLLPLQVYRAVYVYDDVSSGTMYNNIYDPYSGFGDEGEWRIVGIYEHDYEVSGAYDLHPNTVFLPKASLKGNYEQESYLSCPDQYLSFILPQDGMEKFTLEAESAGYAGWFVHSDGGRAEKEAEQSRLSAALELWKSEASSRAKTLSFASLVLMLLSTFLLVWSKKKEIGTFYRIETTKKTIFLHLLMQLIFVHIVSLGLSCLVGTLLLPRVSLQMLKGLADPAYAESLLAGLGEQMPSVAAVYGKCALILLAVSVVCAAVGAIRKYQFFYHDKE